jgi:hypothetical protein
MKPYGDVEDHGGYSIPVPSKIRGGDSSIKPTHNGEGTIKSGRAKKSDLYGAANGIGEAKGKGGKPGY